VREARRGRCVCSVERDGLDRHPPLTIETSASCKPAPLPGSFASTKPAEEHALARGRIYLYQVTPRAIYAQVVGHLDVKGAEAFKAFADRAFARAPSTDMFHDWGEMTSYDSEARSSLTRWTIVNRKSIGSVVFLVRSKLVAMGVATANLATSPLGVTLHSHTDRAAFERELAKLVR
jgi:hypothetical protein